jgi:hypothetical protein
MPVKNRWHHPLATQFHYLAGSHRIANNGFNRFNHGSLFQRDFRSLDASLDSANLA